MNFTLSNSPAYIEIKTWFEYYIEELPFTLDAETKYYLNVKETVQMNITRIDYQINQNKGVNRIAKSSKRTLLGIYIDLQVLENWNKPMEKIEDRGY
jgi:hypothetical protein